VTIRKMAGMVLSKLSEFVRIDIRSEFELFFNPGPHPKTDLAECGSDVRIAFDAWAASHPFADAS